eukprot:UN04565
MSVPGCVPFYTTNLLPQPKRKFVKSFVGDTAGFEFCYSADRQTAVLLTCRNELDAERYYYVFSRTYKTCHYLKCSPDNIKNEGGSNSNSRPISNRYASEASINSPNKVVSWATVSKPLHNKIDIDPKTGTKINGDDKNKKYRGPL